MTDFCDDEGVTGHRFILDDSAVAALLERGVSTDAEMAEVAAFVTELRAAAVQEVKPSTELLAMFEHGLRSTPLPAAGGRTTSRRTKNMLETVVAKLAALGLAGKLGLGATVALAAVGGGGAAGVLPGPAQDVVAEAVAAVTPFEFPSEADDNAAFGERVSTDATDGGVDGPTIADEASDGRSGGDASAEGRAKAAAAKAAAEQKAAAARQKAAAAKAAAQARADARAANARASSGSDRVPAQAPPADTPRGDTAEESDQGLQRSNDAQATRPVSPPANDTAPEGDTGTGDDQSSGASSSGLDNAGSRGASGRP